MKNYFSTIPKNSSSPLQEGDIVESSSKKARKEANIDISNLPTDPGERIRMFEYDNHQEEVRRAYLLKGPCQPFNHSFPKNTKKNDNRRFNPEWFRQYPGWLEYSIKENAAYCLYCYLFKPSHGDQGGGSCFVTKGWQSWKNKSLLDAHVGSHGSLHNQARHKCEALMNTKQHVSTLLDGLSELQHNKYNIRLKASLHCVRFLQQQGLAFRGHDESNESINLGNFLELLQFVSDHNEKIKKVVLQNAPANSKMTSPDIQKDIANCVAEETTSMIIKDLNDTFFAILVDESRDISIKEQLALVIRYVNSHGCVMERFLGIVHVGDTRALTLKLAVEYLLTKHGLSLSRVHGQGYDGASNMSGELNGLKALILQNNPSAYFVHCFAHQLQLTLVAVAKNHIQIGVFFNTITSIFNVVGSSCKRRDILREQQALKVLEALNNNEIANGRGKHQELGLKRPGDTRWGSHYASIINLINIFSIVNIVIKSVEVDAVRPEQKAEASILFDAINTFEFAFNMHLMKNVLGITNELSQALQRKDQDIVNAMNLVDVSKKRLQEMRESMWCSLIQDVNEFCEKHDIEVLDMHEIFVHPGRSRRNRSEVTNLQHYRVDLYYIVLDMQLSELNNRFTVSTSELLCCVACLDPRNSFLAFNKHSLLKFAQYYPIEFSESQISMLEGQLETYILDMRMDTRFSNLQCIGDLSRKMVEFKKVETFQLVYKLLQLSLILPVATATVERAFSAMGIVKNRLRNSMGDQWLNDNLVAYVEKDISKLVDDDAIIQRFQAMKNRRLQIK